MQPSASREEPWFVRAFDRIYLDVYPHRDDAEAERHADSIVRLLGLRAGQRILDVACGAGRYARAFARRGLRVTGIDLSPSLLEEARDQSGGLPGAPMYVRWDMRQLPFVGQFEGAVSLFTSFGYTERREDDLALMQGVHRSLVRGGSFLLDFLNEAGVRAGLEPSSASDRSRYHLTIERRVDEDAAGGPRVHKRVVVRGRRAGLVTSTFEESVRLYTREDVDGLLADAGLVPQGEPLGDLDGRPFSPDAPRLIRVARRP